MGGSRREMGSRTQRPEPSHPGLPWLCCLQKGASQGQSPEGGGLIEPSGGEWALWAGGAPFVRNPPRGLLAACPL